jgi:hypothetical protein
MGLYSAFPSGPNGDFGGFLWVMAIVAIVAGLFFWLIIDPSLPPK